MSNMLNVIVHRRTYQERMEEVRETVAERKALLEGRQGELEKMVRLVEAEGPKQNAIKSDIKNMNDRNRVLTDEIQSESAKVAEINKQEVEVEKERDRTDEQVTINVVSIWNFLGKKFQNFPKISILKILNNKNFKNSEKWKLKNIKKAEAKMLSDEKTRLAELVVTDPDEWEFKFQDHQAKIESSTSVIHDLKCNAIPE